METKEEMGLLHTQHMWRVQTAAAEQFCRMKSKVDRSNMIYSCAELNTAFPPYTCYLSRILRRRKKSHRPTSHFCAFSCEKLFRIFHLYLCVSSDCIAGRFGTNCDSECHCANKDEVCNSKTGECESGCDIHWEGKSCQRE